MSNIELLPEMQQWISADERLPEDKSIVMTYGAGCADSEYCQAYFSVIDGKPRWQELNCCGDFLYGDPTHWMPPHPINGGGHE